MGVDNHNYSFHSSRGRRPTQYKPHREAARITRSSILTLSNQTGRLSLRRAPHLSIARSAAAHGELVEPRGNLVEAEHTSANHHCYTDEIANPRIEYGVAMTR